MIRWITAKWAGRCTTCRADIFRGETVAIDVTKRSKPLYCGGCGRVEADKIVKRNAAFREAVAKSHSDPKD